MPDVFLSYKREDAARVRKLVAALRAAGLDAWWDEDIPGGAQWEATIEKALAAAKAVVVCWSPESVTSENVRSEARVAREDGRLVQVFLKPCTPPLFFGERQGFDLTKWRGKADDPRVGKLIASVRKVVAGERTHSQADGSAVRRRRTGYGLYAALSVLVLLVAATAGWWFLGGRADEPQTLAILPFRALNPSDANLVDAVWDDTRGAISRNPNLRVLGRQAVEVLAKQGLQPGDYRRKVGADFLLDGNVQRAGDKVLINLSLTRTSDGAEIWSDSVGGKLDDVFAFQQQVAREVEGRIRGRVAPGGGVKAQNIATSGDVYALFADARAKLHERNQQAEGAAFALLHKVVAADPNYAPAWAELGSTRILYWGDHKLQSERNAEAIGYSRRALTLAPNLAHAHAALGEALGTSPEAETELRRAVALDPGDAEAWNWLGNYLGRENRLRDALIAYDHAAEIEPLWSSSVGNKMTTLAALGDRAGIERELQRLHDAGADVLATKQRAALANYEGHPGDGLRISLQLVAAHPEEKAFVGPRLTLALTQLGFVDEAIQIAGGDAVALRIYRDGTLPPPGFASGPLGYNRPVEFWLDDDNPAVLGRLMLKQGRVKEYLGYYRAAFRSADDFMEAFADEAAAIKVIPTVAALLGAGGEQAESDALLQRGEARLLKLLRNGPATPDLLIELAQYRALDGNGDQAVGFLRRAAAAGWLPDRRYYAIDIVDEPAFARLVNRSDFQAVRRFLIARIEQERRKVPVTLLAQAYPSSKKAAA